MGKILVKNNHNVAHGEFRLPDGEHFLQVPDGEYSAYVLGQEAFFYRGNPRSPRVALWFRIRDDVGPERRIAAYYRVLTLERDGEKLHPKDLGGNRPRRFEFRVGWRADLANDLVKGLWLVEGVLWG